jgi:hydrogenase maturation protease
MGRTVVVGVGNILMGDEGVGVKAVRELEHEHLPEGVELFDGGTAFYALSGELSTCCTLIIVDAVQGEGPPGTVYRFRFEEIEEGAGRAGMSFSLHDVGVIETLRLERLVHRIPEEIIFVGIEPERIELSMELSPVVEKKLPALVQAVLRELETDAAREPYKEEN